MKKIILKTLTMFLFIADIIAFLLVCVLVYKGKISDFNGVLLMFMFGLLCAPTAYFAFSMLEDYQTAKMKRSKNPDFDYYRKG